VRPPIIPINYADIAQTKGARFTVHVLQSYSCFEHHHRILGELRVATETVRVDDRSDVMQAMSAFGEQRTKVDFGL
jgi:hypothetical protein